MEIKYIVNISGMGGPYEEVCQNMLQAGFDWLQKNPNNDILDLDGEDRKSIKDVIHKVALDCSGAQHGAVMSHLSFIQKQGFAKWIRTGAKNNQIHEDIDNE